MMSGENNVVKAVQVPDVYGQVHPLESPEFIKSKLEDFDAAVKERTEKRDNKNKSLLQAMEKCPELLTNDFKLMFLRSEDFNTDLAVKRYCNYWEYRVMLAGPVKAFQPVSLKNYPQDRVAMEDGILQIVPGNDPEGRAILYMNPGRRDLTKYTRESVVRACFMVVAVALENETVQKHGAVILYDLNGLHLYNFDHKMTHMILSGVEEALPMRTAAVHICRPPAFVRFTFPIVRMFMSQHMRDRVYFHKGSTEQVLEHLQVYGLNKDILPTEVGGNVELDHLGWLKERRARET